MILLYSMPRRGRLCTERVSFMALERLDTLLSSTGRWSRKELRDMARQGRIVLVVTHDQEFLQRACDRVLRL